MYGILCNEIDIFNYGFTKDMDCVCVCVYVCTHKWIFLISALYQKITEGITLDPERAMAPHSSTLAWKIPWTEEPGGLPSMGSHRVRHD